MSKRWQAGWYASRLHAVADDGRQALCGAWVFESPQTEWARRRLERGPPKCMRCLRIVAKIEEGGGET